MRTTLNMPPSQHTIREKRRSTTRNSPLRNDVSLFPESTYTHCQNIKRNEIKMSFSYGYRPSEHEVENEAAEAVKNSKRHVHKLLDSALPFDEYLRAESAGKAGKNCDRLYRFCTRSPLESFSEIIYEEDEEVEND